MPFSHRTCASYTWPGKSFCTRERVVSGITQTLSITVYLAAQDDLDTAVALSVLLLAVSFGVLLLVQLGRRKQGVGAETRGR